MRLFRFFTENPTWDKFTEKYNNWSREPNFFGSVYEKWHPIFTELKIFSSDYNIVLL